MAMLYKEPCNDFYYNINIKEMSDDPRSNISQE